MLVAPVVTQFKVALAPDATVDGLAVNDEMVGKARDPAIVTG